MGSGKTSIGKTLAKKLERSFIDSDQRIEEAQKQTISEIFESRGETFFRTLESNWLKNYSDENSIVSLGGGMPCFNNNIDILSQKGVIVYLTVPIKMIAQRLVNGKSTRPIIEPYRHNAEALLLFLTELLAQREPFYKQADLIFEASNMSKNKYQLLAKMVAKILEKKTLLL